MGTLRSGEVGIWKLALLAVVSLASTSRAPAEYRAVVEQFATAPDYAIERMLALPAADVAAGVRDAVRHDSG